MSVVKPFVIKKDDLEPPYPFRIMDTNGSPVDLTGKTVACTLVDVRTGQKKLDAVTVGISITDAPAGEGEYQWQPGSTDTEARYRIQFIVTESGRSFTVPSDDGAIVVIVSR